MRIVKPSVTILTRINGQQILKRIERIGRVCYKSEGKITAESAPGFVRMLIERGHLAMIELGILLQVIFICDRGVSHEMVRHRVASYAQESTRYCNYGTEKFGGGITVIAPSFFSKGSELYNDWREAMLRDEETYLKMITKGAKAQEARSVLPNSLKTEIVMAANLREWIHFFKMRCAKSAHPQMRQLAVPLLYKLREIIPVIFDDIGVEPYDEDIKDCLAKVTIKTAV